MLVVAAAGNWGPDEGTISCPGNAKSAVTVGATDGNSIAGYSSRGFSGQGKPDLVAPGTLTIGRFQLTGTSISAPVVSGIIAALSEKYNIADIVTGMKDDCADMGYPENEQGCGRIDVQGLLEVLGYDQSHSEHER